VIELSYNMTNIRVQFTEEPSVQVYEDDLSRDKRKQLCWYNESELEECRLDARLAVKLLTHFKGKFPDGIDRYSFRGVEKYGSVALQRFKKRRVVVNSVLLRQVEHRSQTEKACPTKMTHDLAALSRKLSKPSTLLAQFHAAKHFGGENDGSWKSYVQSELEEQKDSLRHKRLLAVAVGGPPSKKRCLVPAAS
jgi:hypothetical protein